MTADSDSLDPTNLSIPPVQKRKPGRPSTGQALSRAQIQRDYRQRNKSNVTKNTVEALDENMALRAQVLQLMNQLEEAQAKARAEFELGEQARMRVRELERRLAAVQPGSKTAPIEARYEQQARSDLDGEWFRMGRDWTYKTKSAALAALARDTEGKDDPPYRVLDRKTGKILNA